MRYLLFPARSKQIVVEVQAFVLMCVCATVITRNYDILLHAQYARSRVRNNVSAQQRISA